MELVEVKDIKKSQQREETTAETTAQRVAATWLLSVEMMEKDEETQNEGTLRMLSWQCQLPEFPDKASNLLGVDTGWLFLDEGAFA